MTASAHPGKPKVVARAHAILTPSKDTKEVSLPLPLPCITILVHGVNDVGEAYSAQESGLCKGLNARLDRGHKLAMDARGDLVPSSYRMPPASDADKSKEKIKGDPDAVYFRRTPDRRTWSPVIPFYWGSREEESHIKKDNWHGQWTDRDGNRLDKNGAKNGGPFANATTTLNAMWGDGFNGKVGGSETLAEWASDPLHQLKHACPRHYMLLAAKRLAMLVKMIRNRPGYQNVAINLLCHSQGTMIALAAHALLAEKGGNVSADTLIFQNSPYSLEEPLLERWDGVTGNHQQTTASRIRTLGNIVRYVQACKSSTPALEDLQFTAKVKPSKAVTGPSWRPGNGAQQWAQGEVHAFTERDNRGKVYLYFCPHDKTVALRTVQGIGWQGVPDKIKTTVLQDVPCPGFSLAKSGWSPLSAPQRKEERRVEVTALSALGDGFRQRVFTSRPVAGEPFVVGAAPARYQLRTDDGVWPFTEENSTTGNWSAKVAKIERGETRQITGEQLHPPVQAVLTAGEDGHRGKLAVSPIDAAIAVSAGRDAIATAFCSIAEFRTGERRGAQSLTAHEIHELEKRLPNQRQGTSDPDDRLRLVSLGLVDRGSINCTYSTETANEVRARWQNDATDTNSYHSAIPANPAHAAGVTAYDLSLGAPLPIWEEDRIYLKYLCAVADWRTDWDSLQYSDIDPTAAKIQEIKAQKSEAEAAALVDATFCYYTTGTLPTEISNNGRAVLPRPELIVDFTVADRSSGRLLAK